MQFREFGEWITRIAEADPTEAYLLFVSPGDHERVSELAASVGVRDRFYTYAVPALPDGRMFFEVVLIGSDVGHDSQPLIDALDAASRTDLRDQITEERMLAGLPFTARFDGPLPELEAAVTHPHGEQETGG